ncbi:MAG: hypothetical protein LUI61_00225 [Firmicutes bacterium]|nr:hypothetical protein [Bacillota bacterium]
MEYGFDEALIYAEAEEAAAETEEISETVGEDTSGFYFNPSGFVDTLGYMGRGMLGIFVVMAVIIIATTLCDKLFPAKKKGENDDE